MEKVYARTKGIRDDMVSGFCPGCMHSTVIKLIRSEEHTSELQSRI